VRGHKPAAYKLSKGEAGGGAGGYMGGAGGQGSNLLFNNSTEEGQGVDAYLGAPVSLVNW
jgi:hypothetical protein